MTPAEYVSSKREILEYAIENIVETLVYIERDSIVKAEDVLRMTYKTLQEELTMTPQDCTDTKQDAICLKRSFKLMRDILEGTALLNDGKRITHINDDNLKIQYALTVQMCNYQPPVSWLPNPNASECAPHKHSWLKDEEFKRSYAVFVEPSCELMVYTKYEPMVGDSICGRKVCHWSLDKDGKNICMGVYPNCPQYDSKGDS